MWFWYKTKNLHRDINFKRPIAWIDFDSSQLWIIILWALCIFYFTFWATISWFWKIPIDILIIFWTLQLIKKFDDTKLNIVHKEYGRTLFLWFITYIKKIAAGHTYVDRGADKNYFINRTKNAKSQSHSKR